MIFVLYHFNVLWNQSVGIHAVFPEPEAGYEYSAQKVLPVVKTTASRSLAFLSLFQGTGREVARMGFQVVLRVTR